jgi:hypothetical protein
MLFWIGLLFFVQSTDVPLKASGEFEVNIDLQIKARPYLPGSADPKIDFTETVGERAKKKSGPLPYLALKIKFLKLSDREMRVRILDASGIMVYHKKSKEGSIIRLEMGFIDDIKQGLVSGEYNVQLLSSDKKPTSRVHIRITRDGTYSINDVLCGKF